MTDVGLEFTQKTPDKKQENEKENEKINLTAEERTKIKGIIGNLNINVKPEKVHETIAFMQKLEKNIYVGNKIEKDIFSLLDRTEKNNFDITSSLKEDSPIKWLLSLWALFMGYNGGIDGLVKKRSAGKIENIDSKKKTTIQESFTSYQTAQSAKNAKQEKKAEKGKEKIDEENLQYLLGKALNKENKPLFDIDVPLLKDALIKHGDVNQFSPNVLASMGKIGQEFIKKETKKEEGKNVTSYILDPEKISLLEEKKEKVVDEYINFIAKDLLKKESYLEKLKESEDEKENSPVDKMVFTMIASLYIPQNVVINGVKSETFLPSILNEEKEQQDTTVEKSSKPIEQIASKEKNKSETSPIFTEKQLENRANRHNNPTVMSIDVARNLGLQEGIDYVRGDALKDNAKIFTAKLLWHGVETTIKGFDLAAKNPQEQIFYKSNGKVRRNHTAISDEERLALSPKEKRDFIEEMYNKEVQKTRRNFVAMSDPAQKENIA